MLQSFGVRMILNGYVWYVSALLIASVIVWFLIKNLEKIKFILACRRGSRTGLQPLSSLQVFAWPDQRTLLVD